MLLLLLMSVSCTIKWWQPWNSCWSILNNNNEQQRHTHIFHFAASYFRALMHYSHNVNSAISSKKTMQSHMFVYCIKSSRSVCEWWIGSILIALKIEHKVATVLFLSKPRHQQAPEKQPADCNYSFNYNDPSNIMRN